MLFYFPSCISCISVIIFPWEFKLDNILVFFTLLINYILAPRVRRKRTETLQKKADTLVGCWYFSKYSHPTHTHEKPKTNDNLLIYPYRKKKLGRVNFWLPYYFLRVYFRSIRSEECACVFFFVGVSSTSFVSQ